MGEIYVGAFERSGGEWCTVSEPALCRPQEAPALEGVLGRLRQRVRGPRRRARAALRRPAARRAARTCSRMRAKSRRSGARMLERGEGVDPALAAPLYVRDKVALTVSERAARKAAGELNAQPMSAVLEELPSMRPMRPADLRRGAGDRAGHLHASVDAGQLPRLAAGGLQLLGDGMRGRAGRATAC